MPAPLPVIALTALRFAAVAGVAYAAGRRRARPQPEAEEQVLDDVAPGFEADCGREPSGFKAYVKGRTARVIRISRNGPGLSLEAAGLARLRLKPLGPRSART